MIDAGDLSVGDIVQELGIQVGTPVVVLVGGARNLDMPAPAPSGPAAGWPPDVTQLAEIRAVITRFFERSLGPAIRDAGAVLLTGGTNTGIMQLAGEFLERDAEKLVGVVPKVKVAGASAKEIVEPRHDAVVMTAGQTWGSETRTLFALAEAITGDRGPGLVVVANGGRVTVEEVERFTDGGWPILVVPATSGAAELLALKHAEQVRLDSERSFGRVLRRVGLRRPPVLPPDLPRLTRELPSTVDIEVLSSDAAQALAALDWRLSSDTSLKAAWTRHAAFDAAAGRYRARATLLRRLAVCGLLLPVALASWFVQIRLDRDAPAAGPPADIVDQLSIWLRDAMLLGHNESLLTHVTAIARVLLVFLPIALAVGAAIAANLSPDRRWRAVRAGSESLLARIYLYRAALSTDAPAETVETGKPTRRLAATMHAVDTQLLQAGVPLASLGGRVVRERPSEGVHADALAPLTARLYLRHRVADQLEYFHDAHLARDRRDRRTGVIAAVVAAVAVATAGTTWAPWFGFLLLVVATLAIVRMRQQVREELETFDRAVADIEDARLAWDPHRGVGRLVRSVEAILRRQGDAWVQNMNRGAKQASAYASGFSG